MVTKNPRWHGTSYAKDANRHDAGNPGHPVDTDSWRHEHILEPAARKAVRETKGSRAEKLAAGEKAHNKAEKEHPVKKKGKK